MLKSYLKKISKIANQGDAREESYYSTLELLLKEAAQSFGKPKIHITTLPKSTEAGNPDFRVWDGKQHIVGYIEAKAPTIENLDLIEDSEQLKRYRNTFPNLILTNFFEFRLYRNGMLVEKTLIARPFIVHKLKTIPPVEKESDFIKLMEAFYSFSLPKVYNAKNLAIELAKRTRFLKDEVITEELAEEEKNGKGFILGFYEAFRQFLISGLSKEDFADLYSQTITYGLFAARMRAKNGFNRKLAYDNIPPTIGILRDVFRFVSLEDVPAQMEWIIDDIAGVLSVADVHKLLQEYFREGKGKDPVVHFYETFLAEYDPKTRERRGVYYTPEPVVSYIVRSIHHILKDRFGRADGIANDSVTVLDPASGTLTFLAEAAKLAVDEFASKYGQGDKEGFIKEHILKNFYAFELMMAPYAVGHLKMAFLLEELGYRLQKDDRFKLYLTSTLDMEELDQTSLPGMASLSEESRLAGKVKKEQPILAILGNPPYSGHSANKGEWIDRLLKKGYTHSNGIKDDGYYYVDGKPLGEKNPKWLQDDYVKFIRFGQWKIDQAGEGVLGFITNHSYLDNPTFRGMRRSLMSSFDEIYLLDLHGNSLKKEKCPDGSKDENVFDIRQGTAIALFIKTKDLSARNAQAGRNSENGKKVFHSELWGMRKGKYDWLINNDITTTKWQKIAPKSKFYLFVPRDEKLLNLYEKSPKITDIFPINSVGITTARDKLTIQFTPEKVWTTILNFSKMDENLARMAYRLGKDARDWKVKLAQKDLIDSGVDRKKIAPILYRPFDIRYTYYTGKSRGFHCMPRPKVMRHMMQENLGLITNRQVNSGFKHILCTNFIINDCTVSLETRERSYLFPLFLYPKPDQKDLFSHLKESKERKPNISERTFSVLAETYKTKPNPEDIFYYIYAVFFSNTYRTKYAEFLKTDFPRVPFTKDKRLFKQLVEYGKRLADLHLMRSPELDSPVVKFQGTGDKRVDKIKYDKKGERVYINKDQYFEGIEENVWQYRIGGYQVCDKWLKDRKSNVLSLDDIKHYCKVATAIEHTINIQKSIDEIYNEAEKDLISF
ncbi:type ISP restriction/modification enzyme [Thermodesulfobacteriota bacterium]